MEPDIVFAYIGPGPGLTMTWALIGLVVTVLSGLVAVLFWPVRMLLRRLRSEERDVAAADEPDSVPSDATG